MGAVIHTLNPRLHPDELGFIAGDAEDRAIVVDESLLPAFDGFRAAHEFEHVIVVSQSGAVAGRRARLRVADRGGGADGVAGAARAPGRRDLLHVGDDRPAQRRPLFTPRARPALDGRGAAGRDEHVDSRHGIAGRADVPRQRLGHPLHRQHGRGGARAARAAARRGERARPARGRARDDDRRRADRVDGDAERDRGRARAMGSELAEAPAGGRRGRPQEHDRRLPAPRPVHRPGLGHDRDLPAREHRDRAARDGRRHR